MANPIERALERLREDINGANCIHAQRSILTDLYNAGRTSPAGSVALMNEYADRLAAVRELRDKLRGYGSGRACAPNTIADKLDAILDGEDNNV